MPGISGRGSISSMSSCTLVKRRNLWCSWSWCMINDGCTKNTKQMDAFHFATREVSRSAIGDIWRFQIAGAVIFLLMFLHSNFQVMLRHLKVVTEGWWTVWWPVWCSQTKGSKKSRKKDSKWVDVRKCSKKCGIWVSWRLSTTIILLI